MLAISGATTSGLLGYSLPWTVSHLNFLTCEKTARGRGNPCQAGAHTRNSNRGDFFGLSTAPWLVTTDEPLLTALHLAALLSPRGTSQ